MHLQRSAAKKPWTLITLLLRGNMAYTQKRPLSERPPKRNPYVRCYGGRITPVIIFHDSNWSAKKKQHTSGKIRIDKSKPIICEICGNQIPEYEIKTQRKNRKFCKSCNPHKHTAKSGKSVCPLGNVQGRAFIELFDKEFNLKPIEVK